MSAGEYILRIDKPGFASLFREFNVQAHSNVERGLVLKLGKVQDQVAAETGAAPQPTNPELLRVGGATEEEKLTTKVQPVYPPAAKQAHVQGQVRLEVVISAGGVPEDIRVLASPDDDLTQSALDAVRQWRYTPTLLNGKPVAVVTEVIVNYTLTQ